MAESLRFHLHQNAEIQKSPNCNCSAQPLPPASQLPPKMCSEASPRLFTRTFEHLLLQGLGEHLPDELCNTGQNILGHT